MASSPNDTYTPSVAVVTVSYGSENVLPAFLASVEGASTGQVLVVVADNRPEPDSSVESIVREAGARYLPLASNLGYGGAMNAAVAGLPASVEWVLVSNPDVELGSGSIDILRSTGEEDPRIGSVGPQIMTDGVVYPSARNLPSLRTGVGHALFANIWVGNPWTRAYRRGSDGSPARRDAGWLSGACVLVRRSAFDQLGGFDPGFFMYFEDVDLGYRLGRSSYRNVYEPAATVTHSGAHSTESSSESARMIEAHHASARRFLGKKYSGWALWPVRFALSIGLSVRSGFLRRRSVRD
jgi:N-acetylglucosaminyl-diphospho-decaprenol L-rhamnosyltransferase